MRSGPLSSPYGRNGSAWGILWFAVIEFSLADGLILAYHALACYKGLSGREEENHGGEHNATRRDPAGCGKGNVLSHLPFTRRPAHSRQTLLWKLWIYRVVT